MGRVICVLALCLAVSAAHVCRDDSCGKNALYVPLRTKLLVAAKRDLLVSQIVIFSKRYLLFRQPSRSMREFKSCFGGTLMDDQCYGAPTIRYWLDDNCTKRSFCVRGMILAFAHQCPYGDRCGLDKNRVMACICSDGSAC
ncbi:hypothetical protein L596_013440 [Steinernema carpocapsae]|uniref:EB domain-containing protein n=1 Tax=Steinernema carpocapsae TaxID=34508 RepID=A0A4U5P113_STECR|nr:hypothetical protein L596_013440 [Steinernema carpocapsae]